MNNENEEKLFKFEDFIEFLPAGVITFDDNWLVQKNNQNLFAFNLLAESEIIGEKIFEIQLFQSDELQAKIKLLELGEPFEHKYSSVKTMVGSEIEIIIKGSPIFIDGNFKGGIILIEDLQVDAISNDLEQLSLVEDVLSARKAFFVVSLPDMTIKSSSKFIADDPELNRLTSFENLADAIKLEAANVKASFEYVLQEKKTFTLNSSLSINGEDLVCRISFVPHLNKKGNINLILILFVDKTVELNERQVFEKQIAELQKYHEITSHVLDAIIHLDMNGNIIEWSDNASNLFGISRSEVFGKPIGKIIPSMESNYQSLVEELLENNFWNGEVIFPINETTKVVMIHAGIIKDLNLPQIIFICNDVTEKNETDKLIKLSEEKYRNIVINTQEYIFTFALDGKLNYANPFFINSFGYNLDEIKNLSLVDIISPDYADTLQIKDDNPNNWEKNSIELELIKKDGSKVFVFGNITLIKEINGSVRYCNAVFNDISDKKETEKNLLMIKTVFEASHDGIAIQFKRKYILVNDRFVKMFGYETAEEVLGKDPLDFVAEEEYAKIATQIIDSERQSATNKKIEFRGIKKDGSKFLVEKTSSSYQTKEGVFIVSTLRDVTNERQILKNLEQSEQRFRNILENIDDCLWSTEKIDAEFERIFYSPAIQKITGYPADYFSRDRRLWVKIIHPDDAEKVVSELRNFYKNISQKDLEIEYRIINNIGSTVWIRNKITVLRDKFGFVEKIFGLVSDITLDKKAEINLKKSTEELKTINDTKDKFISIISHDLRTPFSSILGFTDVLLNDDDLNVEKQKQYIGMIQESARNMLSLVNSLLDWTRIQTGRISFSPKRTDAINIVNKAVNMLSGAALQKNIHIAVRIFDNFFIHADENLLMQAFANLISNAIKFTPAGGTISISAQPYPQSRFIQFTVKDNGIGIKQEDISKLFRVDAKFSTLGTSGERGSGLGLTLVKEIINKHGGEIFVQSETGKGSEFIFTIPTSSISVLIVDQSKTDRILYSKIIRNFLPQYSIIEADSGARAIEISSSSFPAIIISENKLPDISGRELVKRILFSEDIYKPPVIILGRDVSDIDVDEYHKIGVEFAFRKPVNLNAFKLAIEKSLKK